MDFFKNCPNCEKVWLTRQHFLEDPEIKFVGYQAHFKELTLGLFLFNHHCRATLALHVKEFIDLTDEPVFTEQAQSPEDCPKYCLNETEMRPCPVKCECRYIREIIQVFHNWPKQPMTPNNISS